MWHLDEREILEGKNLRLIHRGSHGSAKVTLPRWMCRALRIEVGSWVELELAKQNDKPTHLTMKLVYTPPAEQ